MAKKSENFYMYVIQCGDGSLYTGYTVDLQARFKAHCEGRGAKYTAGRQPLKILASAQFETKHDAMRAEAKFKQLTRAQKFEMLSKIRGRRTFRFLLTSQFLTNND